LSGANGNGNGTSNGTGSSSESSSPDGTFSGDGISAASGSPGTSSQTDLTEDPESSGETGLSVGPDVSSESALSGGSSLSSLNGVIPNGVTVSDGSENITPNQTEVTTTTNVGNTSAQSGPYSGQNYSPADQQTDPATLNYTPATPQVIDPATLNYTPATQQVVDPATLNYTPAQGPFDPGALNYTPGADASNASPIFATAGVVSPGYLNWLGGNAAHDEFYEQLGVPENTDTLYSEFGEATVPDLVGSYEGLTTAVGELKTALVIDGSGNVGVQLAIANERDALYYLFVSPESEVAPEVLTAAAETGGGVFTFSVGEETAITIATYETGEVLAPEAVAAILALFF
jgi:hypothetical protein